MLPLSKEEEAEVDTPSSEPFGADIGGNHVWTSERVDKGADVLWLRQAWHRRNQEVRLGESILQASQVRPEA